MNLPTLDPIDLDGESAVASTSAIATAASVSRDFSSLEVRDIDNGLTPFMAAAAAELALLAGVEWRFSADDPPVALLRMIAKCGIIAPEASGPHTARLAEAIGSRHSSRAGTADASAA